MNRPFLKWAGGKAKLAARISAVLPKAQCLVEPFVGAGSI
ncbi:MAG: DNA adenine methylase, partial [Pararheinheimera sp.]|nr:DNA adenine methylase [Rheinheimera sp.]